MGIGAIYSFSLRQKVRRQAYARVNHMSGTFRDLESWQKAFDLALAGYSATRAFPKEETYGLTIQLRRAAVSVVSNIAEGKGRTSDKELLQFCRWQRAHCSNWKPSWSWQSIWRT